MARLCVRVTKNDHPTNPSLTPFRTNEGDVVCIVDDAHVFSQAELTCGHYRIIEVPGVLQEDLVFLTAPVLSAEDTIVKRRAMEIDLALALSLPVMSDEVRDLVAHRDEALGKARMARRKGELAENDMTRRESFVRLAMNSGLPDVERAERANQAAAQAWIDEAREEEQTALFDARQVAGRQALLDFVTDTVQAVQIITRTKL